MLRELMNNKKKTPTETAKKIYSVYCKGVITEHQVWNCFLKFCSGYTSLRDEHWAGRSKNLDEDDLR